MFVGLRRYLQSVKARDPAPRSSFEILLYPGVWALALHRMAHWLFLGRMFFLARFVNHFARLLTAIDIHPGAKIGKNFFIDHGFTVIGETAVIGNNVTIYQSVTLGGTNPTNGEAGKRHPTIMDDAIIGSGAQILGPVIVGKGARIGAAAVVTEDVAAGTTMVGPKARSTEVKAQGNTGEFVPYGTPCEERYDPATQSLELLQCELDTLRKRIAAEMAARDAADAAAKKKPKPRRKAAAKTAPTKTSAAKTGAVKASAVKASGAKAASKPKSTAGKAKPAKAKGPAKPRAKKPVSSKRRKSA